LKQGYAPKNLRRHGLHPRTREACLNVHNPTKSSEINGVFRRFFAGFNLQSRNIRGPRLRALAGNGGGIATLDFRRVAFERPWPRAARAPPTD
jgi:hypothetical protein